MKACCWLAIWDICTECGAATVLDAKKGSCTAACIMGLATGTGSQGL